MWLRCGVWSGGWWWRWFRDGGVVRCWLQHGGFEIRDLLGKDGFGILISGKSQIKIRRAYHRFKVLIEKISCVLEVMMEEILREMLKELKNISSLLSYVAKNISANDVGGKEGRVDRDSNEILGGYKTRRGKEDDDQHKSFGPTPEKLMEYPPGSRKHVHCGNQFSDASPSQNCGTTTYPRRVSRKRLYSDNAEFYGKDNPMEISDTETDRDYSTTNKISRVEAEEFMKSDVKLFQYLTDCTKLDEAVVIVNFTHLTRGEISGLKPREWLPGVVIDTLVQQLIIDARDKDDSLPIWHFPTTFSYSVITRHINAQNLALEYCGKDKFTGELLCCDKIYVPMNYMDLHWYVVVVDIVQNRVDICDTLLNDQMMAPIDEDVNTMLTTLDEMLEHYNASSHEWIGDITQYIRRRPSWVPRQVNGDDCGLLVCLILQHGEKVRLLEGSSSMERRKLACQLWRHRSNSLNPLAIKMN